MKIAIVTFVRAYNYGATLQCYALSKKLQELSMDVQVLDYFPDYFRNSYSLSYLGKLRAFPPYRPLRNWWMFAPLIKIIRKRNQGFEDFIQKNIPLTEKQYHTFEEIDHEQFPHDMFISGSDQVWSCRCVPFDPVYFLTFASATPDKKYSYAASFGFDEVPDRFKSEYKNRLQNWSHYSVRESNAVGILHDLVGANAVQSCDPTLLLNANEWKAIATNKTYRKPFILVYDVNNSSILFEKAEELSKAKKMPVYMLTSNMHHTNILGLCEHASTFRNCASASPQEWLNLFFSADYVLTDSFHGTVFSILAHKNFSLLSDHKNGRAINLLNSLGLERRIGCSNDDIVLPVDWNSVDEKLQQIREASLSHIHTMLQKRKGLLSSESV